MNRFLSLLLVVLVSLPVLAANYEFVDATSMGASFNSGVVDVKNFRPINMQVVVSSASSPVGYFELQCSNDTAATPTNWTVVEGTRQNITAATSFVYDIKEPSCRRYRIAYTRTSGSATADARVELKESGVPHQ